MQLVNHEGQFSLVAKAIIATLCAAAYFVLFQLNFILFADLEFSEGVNWIFLPSGLRLLLVLVLYEMGAIGIGLGSLAINYFLGDINHSNYHLFNVVTAFISGFAPYLARRIAVDWFNIDVDLQGMTSKIFFKITLLFAVISPLLHQLWFYWCGVTDDFVQSTFAMFIGDWFGTILVLSFANLLAKGFTRLTTKNKVDL